LVSNLLIGQFFLYIICIKEPAPEIPFHIWFLLDSGLVPEIFYSVTVRLITLP